ncbi:endolytic transglycosylase MltG [Mucilaginibacter sp. 44-25]|uniref:endolytic transglycosylase MltG n=1 Tax=Mucilaginibacter sp. 44-25 TaxID=1895794 RepID=UPI00095A8F38|nr:endolytic transglycosylase MltG [Mucilaginibacter sp. 44-25]OJW13246.1 MAG: aminodeoxychorismate lyase [Mucilaginibacter sp. 44-25]HEK20118.1 endolytic transglycosylase MltG [Bacteroidota bacterium]
MKKFWIALAVIIVLSLLGTGVFYYLRFFGPNVTDKQQYLYIKTGSNFDDVYKTISSEGIVNDTTSFMQAAHSMKYLNVKPGKYRLKPGMSNRNFINMLKSGNQEPVNFSFHNIRLKEQFAGLVGKNLEPDSASMLRLLDSAKFAEQYGLTIDNIYTVFIPNTYQIYWNTTPEKLFKRLYANYEKFWTPERKQKAAALNLSPQQVSVLASIVDAEALHDDEMPTIAGLYLNRLNKGMKLQSDPTVIFATRDFTIKRVLNRDLLTNSPYNTYMYKGLPPGPIMMPSVAAIDAVLNHKNTDYLYMCAKADFSGYHAFATNEAEHKINARAFQQALNERNIKR